MIIIPFNLNKNHRIAININKNIFTGSLNNIFMEFVGISSPPYMESKTLNTTDMPINKGNLVSTYTDQFDDVPSIDGMEIRDLVRHQQEEAKQETLDELNRDVVKPFQWSESAFSNDTHEVLPDKWEFKPFQPNWSW